jgi:8-oxo-dGTP pyrophosphatase MutT (NUDIX family)
LISFNWTEIDLLYAQGLAAGRQGVVGLLVVRGHGPDRQVFAQRRSLTRKLFPGCWDLVGGHLEAGKV